MENQIKEKPKKTSPWTFISNLFRDNRDLDSTLLLTLFQGSFCWYMHICHSKPLFMETAMSGEIMDLYYLSFPLIVAFFFKKDSDNNIISNGEHDATNKKGGFFGFLSNVFRSNKDLDSTLLLVSFAGSFTWFMRVCAVDNDFAGSEIADKITKMYSVNLALLVAYFFSKKNTKPVTNEKGD